LLQPEGRGELAIAILWPSTLAYLLLFGLSDAVLYYSANRQERPERVFAAGLWLGLSLSALAMLAGQWLVIPLPYAHHNQETIALAHALLWLIPLHILGLVFQEMLRGQHRMGAWNALRVALGVGYVLFILVVLIAAPASVDGFGLAFLASHVPPMLGALGLC